ncbi:hypothetical protein D9611_008759 [Ephemerocybe angulata]|uniref:Adhesion regulating molecule n=1 Tax=Ephemerocybe angulata TaxID=980116 RepID=A0A8H5CC41_9AGAR|nr:hypothetical protein D9611_008759 [Tulosesus angulatus]
MPASVTNDTLLAFKAGRAFRRDGSNIVEADPAKGAILLTNGDDGLLHFIWKNRETDVSEEDLIIFPTDATFTKVDQSNGRVYVLKFSSSNQRHFFWMQDASSARDDEFANNVNGVLQDPEHPLQWGTSGSSSSSAPPAQASSSTTTSTTPAAATPGFQATPEQLDYLQTLLRAGGATTGAAEAAIPEASLVDILTPANLTPLFTNHPELVPTLFPYLPPDLPMPPSAEVVQRIIHSPQFRAAVASFDQALRTGLLGNLVRQLGLPEEAGLGIAPFLRAVQAKADRENREAGGMDTD